MTEAEAKTRWCPFARSFHSEIDDENQMAMASVNRGRDGEPDHWCLCIASACMAWRWHFAPSGGELNPTLPGGHCGLAGPRGNDINGYPER